MGQRGEGGGSGGEKKGDWVGKEGARHDATQRVTRRSFPISN